MHKIDIPKLLKKSIVMLSGEEFALRSRVLKEIVVEASGGEDFDLETFVADSSNPVQWLASAGTAPFLSPRRTVVVRNLTRSDAHKEFKPGELPSHALLVLVADDESGDFDRQKRLELSRKEWEKAVVKVGGELISFTVDPKALREQLKSAAESMGKKINDRATETLIEMTGGSYSRAYEELEKVALYIGESPQIGEKEVRHVALPSPEWNVYRMVDAITRGDQGAALRQLRILVGNNSKVEDVAFRTIFPTLSTQFRLFWQARAFVEAKAPLYNPPAKLVGAMLEKPNFLKEKDWRQERALQTARNLEYRTQTKCLKSLADADARIKGQLAGFSPIDTLERMVLEMVAAVGQG